MYFCIYNTFCAVVWAVKFSNGNTDDEEATYMLFTRLLNEAEGMQVLFCTQFMSTS